MLSVTKVTKKVTQFDVKKPSAVTLGFFLIYQVALKLKGLEIRLLSLVFYSI